MILVIGGHASGKRAYVEQLGYGPADFCCGPEEQGPVAYGIQDWVAKDPAGAMDLLPALLEKQVVVCDEVGCGVVPVDPAARLMAGADWAACANSWQSRPKRWCGCTAASPP